MLDRRRLLLGAAAATAVAPSAFAQTRSGSGQAAELNALYDRFFQDDLRRAPEGATELGLDRARTRT
jgi:uncharacterized protein (DUF885 family)